MNRLKKKKAVALLMFFFVIAGCNTNSASPVAKFAEQVFHAIQDEDFGKFEKLTITRADFILKQQKISKFKAKQSYAGGVLKPREQAEQKAQFEQAVNGGDDQIDFKHSEFKSVIEIDEGLLLISEGYSIPSKTLALKLDMDGEIISTEDLPPYFVVVLWHKKFKLLRLEFE
jgi:hypothetical protein